ncbi:MAG: hypothetical protein ACT4OZ_07660 [Gemmatimonadota bacterium]
MQAAQQKRIQSEYATKAPVRRPLKIFATDPMAGRTVGNRITIEVANEECSPGPVGLRVAVIDYDGAHKRYYPPVDLNDRFVLMQGGLDPSESDPRFHQQMVYAVAMRTIENFDRALGRRLEFRTRKHDRLRLLPHAFHGANAFYSRELNAVLFGYFRADAETPGSNLPGQNVFTCLSHDIIVHEVTHAVVDRLRRFFLEPTNEDVLAFHEGFSDLVALFQHFSFPELLRNQIQQSATQLNSPGPLVSLAQQFGEATGMGRALRSALGDRELVLDPNVIEPHARGAILVAAMFDGFFTTYQRRIRDLVRIATGGTGVLPQGDAHPDLVNRIAREASEAAQSTLSMAIRAFDYLPPVDITFGDYLRAMVTADYELEPADQYLRRDSMIQAFRNRRIFAEGVASAAEESLLWPEAPRVTPPIPVANESISKFLVASATNFGRVPGARTATHDEYAQSEEGEVVDLNKEVAVALNEWANANREALDLHPQLPIQVQGFHSVFRVASSGQLLIELVAQFLQTDRTPAGEFGGIPLRGGTTVVAAADGAIRYIISKPLLPDSPQYKARLDRQRAYLSLADATDPESVYQSDEAWATRALGRANFARLHSD